MSNCLSCQDTVTVSSVSNTGQINQYTPPCSGCCCACHRCPTCGRPYGYYYNLPYVPVANPWVVNTCGDVTVPHC